eukprot:m.146973 g.146973  ORF g.146973 m.146973 type:complete len:54 (+) comp16100_c0_seq1:214-375(+)
MLSLCFIQRAHADDVLKYKTTSQNEGPLQATGTEPEKKSKSFTCGRQQSQGCE